MSVGGSTVSSVATDPHDRRAIILAAVASILLVGASLLPLRWAVALLVVLGLVIGAIAAASSMRRLPMRRP